MVEDNNQYEVNQNGPFQTLKPNLLKSILEKLFTLGALVLLLVIILSLLDSFVSISILVDILEVFNISFDIGISFSMFLFLFLLGFLILIILWSYSVNSKKKYEFYEDKLVVHENSLLFYLNTKEIPYKNIVKIKSDNEGLFDAVFNKVFNTGKIILELSGMNEDKIELEFIDNKEQNLQFIHKTVNESLARQRE